MSKRDEFNVSEYKNQIEQLAKTYDDKVSDKKKRSSDNKPADSGDKPKSDESKSINSLTDEQWRMHDYYYGSD